jgi:hypothetical protein
MRIPTWLVDRYPVWLAAFALLMILGDIFTTGHFLKMGIAEGNPVAVAMFKSFGFWGFGALRLGLFIFGLAAIRWGIHMCDNYYSKRGYSHEHMLRLGYFGELFVILFACVGGLMVVCWNSSAITGMPLGPALFPIAQLFISLAPHF